MRLSPRRTPWIFRQRPIVTAVITWIVVFLFFALTTVRTTVSNIELAQHGKQTTATVTELDLNNHGGCRYTFVAADGKQYREDSDSCGVDHQVGDPIAITYLASNPTVTTYSSPRDEIAWGIGLALLIPTVAACLTAGLAWRQRQDRVG